MLKKQAVVWTGVFSFGLMAVTLSACQSWWEGATTPKGDVASVGIDVEPLLQISSYALGDVPSGALFSFNQNVVEADQIDIENPANVQVKITPEIPIKTVFSSRSSLRVTPVDGLLPDTTYRVELVQLPKPIPAQSGTVLELKSPAFAFQTAELKRMDSQEMIAEFSLVFSHPVNLASIQKHLQLRLGSQHIEPVAVTTGTSPNRVDVRLTSALLRQLQTLTIEVSNGVDGTRSVLGTAKGGKAELKLDPNSSEIKIHAASLVEGGNHFQIQVICNDPANGEANSYHWDDEQGESYYTSSRCTFSETEAQRVIHLDPPVPFSITPSNGGFQISATLPRGPVQFRINAGAVSVDGGATKIAFEKSFLVPALAPRIMFSSKGRFLPNSGVRKLPIRHRNVDKVEVTVRKIPAENLTFWMSGYSEQADERTSNIIAKQTLPVTGPDDQYATSWLDLTTMVPKDQRGMYEFTIDSGGNSDASRLLFTNLQLIAKAADIPAGKHWSPRIDAWAIHTDTNLPLVGVTVQAVRPSGQVLASAVTDMAGLARIELPDDPLDPSAPIALIARRGEEWTYLDFNALQTSTAEFAVSGAPYATDSVYKAAAWVDRGVYRPGETVRLAAIVRDDNNLAPPTELPVEVQVTDPRGQLLTRTISHPNAAGIFSEDLSFGDFANLGKYRIQLMVGDKNVGNASFSIEEFVPERLKVTASSSVLSSLASTAIPIDVQADYLFGGKAADAGFEVHCRLDATEFAPKNNKQWHYGVTDPKSIAAIDIGVVNGTLDKEGKGSVKCLESSNAALGVSAVLDAEISVFESGSGRTSKQQVMVPVHPEKYYLGLGSGAKSANPGEPVHVSGVVVDWEGNSLKAGAPKEVKVEVFQLETAWGGWWSEEEGGESWRRQRRRIPETSLTVPVNNGAFELSFIPNSWAEAYLVRVSGGKTATELELPGSGGYWWGEGSSVDQTPRPMAPKTVDLELPAEMTVGKPQVLRFISPFAGRALFTLENQGVIESRWLDVKAGPVEASFTLEKFESNVYASVMILKDPHLESPDSYMPERAFGVKNIRVIPEEYTLPVTLKVPTEVRSNSSLEVEVDVGAGSESTFVTVAAVDEGILQLTRYSSPDPLADVFPNHRLGVTTWETVGWTMPSPAGPSSHTGGDGEGDSFGRVQMVKPVALWSGIVAVGPNGKAKVKLDVPEYRGALRVMVVAAGKKKMGHAEAVVKVRDPLVLQTTLPRFLIQSDVVEIPVFVTNLTGKKQSIQVDLAVAGLPMPGVAGVPPAPVVIDGKSNQTLALAADAAGTVVFKVKATAYVGAARFVVTAKAGEWVSKESLEVPFAPNAPLERESRRFVAQAGAVDLDTYLRDWVPTTERTSIWVTYNPYGMALSNLDFLLDYPHGCIEQTTSTTRPLLYVRNLLPALSAETANANVDDMVSYGIRRVLSMQTPSGGFAYWPGDNEPNGWGTAYGTHMLIDAKQAGFSVPQESLDAAIKYMESEVTRGRGETYRRDDTLAYMHYVLALGGRPQKANAQAMIDALSAVSNSREKERVYLLKAALYRAGDRRYEADLKNLDTTPVSPERDYGWTYYSDLRRRGLQLSVYQDLFGTEGEKAKQVADQIATELSKKRSSYYTTQELVWGVTALGKRVQNTPLPEMTLSVNGRATDPARMTGDKTWTLARASEQSLSLNIASAPTGDLYVMLQSQGIKQGQAWKYGGNGLSVERTFRAVDGTPLGSAGHSLGDLFYTEVKITNNTTEKIENLALVDRLPAGWEIESTRLDTDVSWLEADKQWTLDHMNLRDDRLEAFGGLAPGESREIIYAVRAVTAGEFILPPVEVEAMYNPEVWARSPGGRVRVDGPWDAYLN